MGTISAAVAYSELRSIHEAARRLMNCLNDFRGHYKRLPGKDRAMADCMRYTYSAGRQVLYHVKGLHERWPSCADKACYGGEIRNFGEELMEAIDKIDEDIRALAEGRQP